MVGPDHHLVNYFVGAGAATSIGSRITSGEWRTESWTAKGEVARRAQGIRGMASRAPRYYQLG